MKDAGARVKALLIAACLATSAAAQPLTAVPALPDGAIVLLRHASAPGGGDPPGMRLGDCSTQRNLDAGGRRQARRIGEQLRARGVVVSAVWTSQWCRARETAALAFPQLRPVEVPAFNSFFGDRSWADGQTEQARSLLQRWHGPGVLAVTTHQINIAALAGVSPQSGEGIVVKPAGGSLVVIGKVEAPQ